MLKGIPPVISPELLYILSSMGHGDQIVIADAHFPAHRLNDNTLRADGVSIPSLLDGVLPLFPLDMYVTAPVSMMAPVAGDTSDPLVEQCYRTIMKQHISSEVNITFCERFEFYERAKNAFAVVISGDTAKYGNIILTKGIVL